MNHTKIKTPIGVKDIDSSGSVISGIRMDPKLAYSEIPAKVNLTVD